VRTSLRDLEPRRLLGRRIFPQRGGEAAGRLQAGSERVLPDERDLPEQNLTSLDLMERKIDKKPTETSHLYF
jgi:hypothetical protein